MLANPYNLGANDMSFESQHAMYFQFDQPTYLIRMSFTIDIL